MAENDSSSPINDSKKAADWLFKRSEVGYWREDYDKHPRCINLKTQDMFDSLVELYASVMLTDCHRYEKLMLFNPVPTGVPAYVYAARCYISMWFIDLYISNRKAVKEHCSLILIQVQHYYEQLIQVPHEYDHYLALLNASIRPTFIKHHVDNALYVPIISDSVNVENSNPFGINNFVHDPLLFDRITNVMTDKSCWRFTSLSSDIMGRPCWLFDWHTDYRVCSWFSQDNFDFVDVILAYILGTACTQNLGSKDVDGWQYFAKDTVPENPNLLDYNRVAERHFHGSYEVRTMEIDTEFSVSKLYALINCATSVTTAKRSKRSNELANDITENDDISNDPGDMLLSRSFERAQETDQRMPRFRLIDWVYHCLVVLDMDNNDRISAHRGLILKDFVEFCI